MSQSYLTKPRSNVVSRFLLGAKADLLGIGVFSMAVNMLMLTGPLFMLQVYDRVLSSKSVPTLQALFVLIVALFLFLGVFHFLRLRVLSRVAFRLDQKFMRDVEAFRLESSLRRKKDIRAAGDLTRVRQFISSSTLVALFDLPWSPIFLAVVFYMHVWLGWLALVGIALITVLAFLGEVLTRQAYKSALNLEVSANRFSDTCQRNADSVFAMGMRSAVIERWANLRTQSLVESQSASSVSEVLTSATKAFRLLLQSSILGLGAFLALRGDITPGTMIAASIIGGRALAPIDQVIAGWRGISGARLALHQLDQSLQKGTSAQETIQLPEPAGKLDVSALVKLSPRKKDEAEQPILNGLNFVLDPGDGLGVIGPSASGKSSLANLLIGNWMPDRGSIRFDGATFDQWNKDQVGTFIGYLPQNAELLSGSISENIARFNSAVQDEEVIAAARIAGVHELILELPNGYATKIGPEEHMLSGGQVQRIALARAFFRNPQLIVLDEPNSNLDLDGDQALSLAIRTARKQGATVVVMAHRPSAIASVNKVLVLKGGQQVEFGGKDEVLRRLAKPAARSFKPKLGAS